MKLTPVLDSGNPKSRIRVQRHRVLQMSTTVPRRQTKQIVQTILLYHSLSFYLQLGRTHRLESVFHFTKSIKYQATLKAASLATTAFMFTCLSITHTRTHFNILLVYFT